MEGCHLSCSFHNCKRTFNHPDVLNIHLKDHHKNPAQSLPGKSFLCSTIGCDGSFTTMQQLMDHMRHHHKPNYFFLCESCRAKLRSYRTLLKHLQTCAKVAKGKGTRPEGGLIPDPSVPSTDSDPDGSFQAVDESQQMESNPLLPPQAQFQAISSDQESLSSLAESGSTASEAAKSQNQADAPYSPFPPSLSPAPDPEPQRSPRVGPVSMTPSVPPPPPGSNAVWRKNQGQSFNSRILWEHTRGRYSCLQCGHSTLERKEMTAHIESQHRSPGAKTNDTDASVGSPSSLGKTSTNSESTNYTQL
ncbi:zinc finger protein 414 isoform 1-T1 [Clarias gariepinus]|uniref:zinc finger protein 414 n=1 Tax=Clarias gariepinus TaxID=13013 RepID=UPI00234C9AB0|nr:zinc finger protein 414 [Clarias gariepinus]